MKQSGYDVFDDYLGEILAMAVFAAIAFATFFLENDNFIAFDKGSCYFANYLRAFNCWCAYFNGAVEVGEKNTVEFNAVAFFYILSKIVHIQETIFFGLELLSLDFYDYVHC